MKKKCSLRVVNNGKVLYGTAAQLHKISISGGWDKYHEDLVLNVAQEVYTKIMKEQNSPVLKLVK